MNEFITEENTTVKEEITPTTTEPVKKQNTISTQVAALISILLCTILYFLLLCTVFTREVNTFVVYTQENMDELHSTIECNSGLTTIRNPYYFDFYQPIISTTVHESPDKTLCSRCRDSLEKTTITARNCVAPLLISLPISIVTFVILTHKKKSV